MWRHERAWEAEGSRFAFRSGLRPGRIEFIRACRRIVEELARIAHQLVNPRMHARLGSRVGVTVHGDPVESPVERTDDAIRGNGRELVFPAMEETGQHWATAIRLQWA